MQPRFLAFFALAFVLYVVASIGAAGGELDVGVLAVTLVGSASALAPLWLRARSLSTSEASDRVASLGLVLACALGARLSLAGHSLLGEIACGVALPALGLVLLRLACVLPDAPTRLSRQRWLVPLAGVGALLAALAGVAAALPPLWFSGRSLIAPPRWAAAPWLALLGCLVCALGLRLARRALGSSARALAANLWATLGLAVAGALLALTPFVRGSWSEVALAVAAAACLLGHVFMVTPARVQHAGASARALLALALAAAAALAVGHVLQPLALAPLGALGACLLAFVVAYASIARALDRALAPQHGALLRAIEEVQRSAYGALSFEEFAALVLKPLRRAAGVPEAAPLLVTFDPARCAELDAAGYARLRERTLSHALLERLVHRPGEAIVRSDLSGSLVRRPELAGLVRALDELGALCVLPLRAGGELEGALVIARGERRAPLTLEELLALARLSDALAPIVVSFSSLARARTRADLAEAKSRALSVDGEAQANALRALREQVSAVKAGLGLPLPERDPVQYSPPMRELTARLAQVAANDVPLCLWGETGLAYAAIAQSIHRQSGRASEPFVIVDGAGLSQEAAFAQLFGAGSERSAKPGVLTLIERGTLLVLDVAALAPSAQRALADTLSERRVRPLDTNASEPFEGRLVVTLRRSVSELCEAGALVPELARWFERTAYRVPALRERPEDLESLFLLALDRAARVFGKPAKGIEADALRALIEHAWPGNEAELVSVVERAFASAEGPRIALSDLPPLRSAAPKTLGSFVEQEREILRRALERAGGSRTRAARALGLKRSEFNEKLRALALDQRDSQN